MIVGSGIVGMTIAMELKNKYPHRRVAIIEKESAVGKHASGRNSGVIHSGIYYRPNTLKSTMCVSGGALLRQWCVDHAVNIRQSGKCIIPTKETDGSILHDLHSRGLAAGISNYFVGNNELRKLEPNAFSCLDSSLHIPGVYVVDVHDLLNKIKVHLEALGVITLFSNKVVTHNGLAQLSDGGEISCGHLINAAGMYSDAIAHGCNEAAHYQVVPFKGSYYQLSNPSLINGLVYPVPDLAMPFLGIHFTKTVDGNVHIGPNASLCFGKENYKGLDSVDISEAKQSLLCAVKMFMNKPKMRKHIYQEILNLSKWHFVKQAKKMVPSLTSKDVMASQKCGIRAQLVDKRTNELVDDFLVVQSGKNIHILNAVSPALTCSMSFAKYIVDQYLS